MTDLPPPWVIHLIGKSLRDTWKKSSLPFNRFTPCHRSSVEQFKATIMVYISNSLDDHLQVIEPAPVIKTTPPDDITQPTLADKLPYFVPRFDFIPRLKSLGKTIFIDLETTGLSTQNDRVCQISIIMINHSHDPYAVEKWSKKVCPEMDIPLAATEIHGITTEASIQHRPLSYYQNQICKYLKDALVVGFNSSKFDMPLLLADIRRKDPTFTGFSHKHQLDLAQIFWKKIPKNLETAFRYYTGGILKGAHDAEKDAMACLQMLPHILICHNLPSRRSQIPAYISMKKLNLGTGNTPIFS
jgi:DNA polymerase III epsilon subunit-like protein